MTEEEKYDRWERFAKLWYERSVRESRESRKQTAQLRFYVEAQREYEVAQLAVAAKPDDADANEILDRAMEVLRQARDELKR